MIAIHIPQTHYISASGWSFEHPMRQDSAGKPMGPAVGLIGAAGAIGAGMSMGGLVGGLMIAGGVASGIGGLTGNKFLSKLGMGLSLAGGISGAFTAAGPGQEMFGYNPFGEGGLGGSALGDAASGIGDWFKDFTGGGSVGTNLPTAPGVDAETAANVAQFGPLSEESGGGMLAKLGINTAPSGASGSKGLIGGLWDSLGQAGKGQVISGALQGAMSFNPELDEAQTDQAQQTAALLKERTQSEDLSQQMLQNRYNNMQYQNVNAPTANPNYSQPSYSGPAQGSYVVSDPATGNILRLTAEQYAQWQQQQGAPA